MRSVPLLIIFTWRCGAFRPAPLRRICESSTGRDIVVGHEVRGGGERCKWSIITRTEPLSVTKDAEQMTDRGGVSLSKEASVSSPSSATAAVSAAVMATGVSITSSGGDCSGDHESFCGVDGNGEAGRIGTAVKSPSGCGDDGVAGGVGLASATTGESLNGGVVAADLSRMGPVLEAAYAQCDKITGIFAKTFYQATKLMSEKQRKAVWAIYVWCRRTDDLVDGPRAMMNTDLMKVRKRFR